MKKIAIHLTLALGGVILATGIAGYWAMCIFSVTVINQTGNVLTDTEADLAGHVLYLGAIAPGKSVRAHGTAKKDGVGSVSFGIKGESVHRSIGYITPELASAYIVTVRSPRTVIIQEEETTLGGVLFPQSGPR